MIFGADEEVTGTESTGGNMVRRDKLAEEQAMYAIQHGDFPEELRKSQKNVAVVMTQDWCPQWGAMSTWLDTLKEDDLQLDIYILLYNRERYFEEFLHFKETSWRNDLVPYVRYYTEGKFVGESNYVSRSEFLKSFL